jgi:hypothetical protein
MDAEITAFIPGELSPQTGRIVNPGQFTCPARF